MVTSAPLLTGLRPRRQSALSGSLPPSSPSSALFFLLVKETVYILSYKWDFAFFFFKATPMAYGSSGLGVESELQLPAYTTATAKPDPSRVCDLCHTLWQHQILNPLSKAGDGT